MIFIRLAQTLNMNESCCYIRNYDWVQWSRYISQYNEDDFLLIMLLLLFERLIDLKIKIEIRLFYFDIHDDDFMKNVHQGPLNFQFNPIPVVFLHNPKSFGLKLLKFSDFS